MGLEAVDHTLLVAVEHVYDAFGVLIPEEDVAAVGSRDNKFTPWSVKIHTLNCSTVEMALIPLDILCALVAVGVEEVDVLVVVGSDDLRSVVIVDSAGDVCQ